MMYQTFRLTQQSGVMALESHCDDPATSAIFSRYPRFLANHHALDFFTDSVRVIIMGGVSPYDLEALMDADLEVHHREAIEAREHADKVSDALPGLGIVAAVLGVVITMQAIDGPPAEIGHKVGAALVGTFLGILMCYGFVGPMATSLEYRGRARTPQYLGLHQERAARLEQGRRAGRLPSSSRAAPFPRKCAPGSPRPSSTAARRSDATVRPRRRNHESRTTSHHRRKKKSGGHGHHGGAWKVAYADFVTAMMAFFLVMWLVGQSKAVKSSVGRLLPRPGRLRAASGRTAPIAGGEMRVDPEPTDAARTKPERAAMIAEERQALEETAQRIRTLLAQAPDLKNLEKQIEIQITRDGLRIELLDGDQTTFFASGSSALAPGTEHVLSLIARELGKLRNSIVIEGHTDSLPYINQRRLLQLGAVGRSRQRRAPHHGAQRPAGDAGPRRPRLRRSQPACDGHAARPPQPPRLGHRRRTVA